MLLLRIFRTPNRYFAIGIIALFYNFCLIAQDPFKTSAVLLHDGNLTESIELMNGLLTEGKISKELYSNLAYAYFQQDELAHAMLYYHKALKLDPSDQQIIASIQNVREELEIQITDIPGFFLITTYRDLVKTFSSGTWSGLQIFMGLIFVICLGLFLFPRRTPSKKILVWSGIASLLLTLLFGIFAFSKKKMQRSQSSAIVMQRDSRIHVSPDEISPEIAPVSAGNQVFILDELGDWYKVTLRDKDVGWIKKDIIEVI